MTNDSQEQRAVAASIMRSTGADAYFTLLVDATLRKLRVAMAAPAAGSDEIIDREFEGVRKLLDKFHAEYQQSYSALLLRHLEPALVEETASVLGSKVGLAYFRALREMEAELGRVFEELGARMLQHARYRALG